MTLFFPKFSNYTSILKCIKAMSKLRSKEPLMFRGIKLRRDSTFEVLKGRRGSKIISQSQDSVVERQIILARYP
jgi:hypothetical protein